MPWVQHLYPPQSVLRYFALEGNICEETANIWNAGEEKRGERGDFSGGFLHIFPYILVAHSFVNYPEKATKALWRREVQHCRNIGQACTPLTGIWLLYCVPKLIHFNQSIYTINCPLGSREEI